MTSTYIYEFESNKYTRTYFSIIEKRKLDPLPTDQYGETHHIFPKSLGGNNSKTNLIRISAREHFVLHWLLTKMVVGQARHKMLEAFSIFSNNKNRELKFTSRKIASLREANSIAASMRNKGNQAWKCRGDTTPTRLLQLSEIAKNSKWVNNDISESFAQNHEELVKSGWKYGRKKFIGDKKPRPPTSEETKLKLSIASKKALTGIKKSKEHRDAMSRAMRLTVENAEPLICPHCGYKSKSHYNMKRWHFDNCKKKLAES